MCTIIYRIHKLQAYELPPSILATGKTKYILTEILYTMNDILL